MRKRTVALLTFTLLLLGLLWLLMRGPTLQAASGITVSPAFLNASLTDQQPVADLAVGVRNNFAVAIDLQASIEGINQKNLTLVPTNDAEPNLKNAIEIFPSRFTLQPGQSINVRLRIQNTPDLTPGGHYGGLLIKQVSDVRNRLSLQPAISVTMFVTKEGGAIRSLVASAGTAQRSLFSLPHSLDLTLKNTGNVHVVPRGVINVTRGSSAYAQGVVNEASVPLLPGREVVLRSNLGGIAPASWPGHYNLTVLYRFDGTDQYQSIATSFWYMPFWTVFVGVGVLGGLHIMILQGQFKKLRRLLPRYWYKRWRLKAKRARAVRRAKSNKDKKTSIRQKEPTNNVVESRPKKPPVVRYGQARVRKNR